MIGALRLYPPELLDRIAYAPASMRDPDGQHYNAQRHAAIAAGLLPQVIAAVR